MADEIADGAWRLTAHAVPGRSALDLLACLVDPPVPRGADGAFEHGPLEQCATVRFLLSDTTQRLLSASGGILRDLSCGPQEDRGGNAIQRENDGRVQAGLVDWSGTLIQRMASGGLRTTVVMRRPEIQRDLPKNRLLKFLLLEVERRAKMLSQLATLEGSARGRMSLMASRAARLARHPLLETVLATPSREGLRDAARSPLADDRGVARAYELYEGLWGRGNRDILVRAVRDAVRSSAPLPFAAAMLVFLRAVDAVLNLERAAPMSVRPLSSRRGLVAICQSQEGTIDVTWSKEVLPGPSSAVWEGRVVPAGDAPSAAILIRSTACGVTRLQLMSALPTSDAAAVAARAELLERHVRARWPALRGHQERILVDCATAERRAARVSEAPVPTYVAPLAVLPEIIGRVAL